MATATAQVIPFEKKGAKVKRRNALVRRVRTNEWRTKRMDQFKESTRWAAAAKSYRTALDVTQQEVAEYYGVTSQAVTNWESGMYFGWSQEELDYYHEAIRRIAGVVK